VLRAFDDSKGRGVCRTCGASIWWMQLVSGKRHPFNEQPNDPMRGTPVPQSEELADGRRVLVIDASASHFATCKDSKDWKKKT
jgi:hypothetical protein